MRILTLAWEFPPRIVGGIARHVSELYPELVGLGHDIHLLTIEFGQAPRFEIVDGIKVHRVAVHPSHQFFQWVTSMNETMEAHGSKLLQEDGPFDLIHAHDWLVGDAAIALKHTFKLPLVSTIHATEFGRHNGLHTPTHHYIGSKEAQLAAESWRLIVCSQYMRQEVQYALHATHDKIDVVYNGIRPEKKPQRQEFDYWQFRRRFAADYERIVYYVGRMTYEKGIQVLIRAAPQILWETGGTAKFVIIGSGSTDPLKQLAWELGIWEKCYFTGFMPDDDLNKFQTIADCAVFPSLYEPFGIVALESFAARVPVVVSDTGGLPEVVHHTRTGIVTATNNVDSLAWGILEVLRNPGYAKWLIDNAYADLDRRFNWAKLAHQTEVIYQRVLEERQETEW
ncbi:MAG: glycosyltransferase family 4 protein [Leptolyngbyaceae cyanobacterium SL_7_1]|nr:glycosyltransferase family 4 protein [Leptolyngbyaceae cyanobacterium SL_7_1]